MARADDLTPSSTAVLDLAWDPNEDNFIACFADKSMILVSF